MANIRIEMDRGNGWEVRQEGAADVTADDLVSRAIGYSISYPHRFFLDGALIASTTRPHGLRNKARLIRHDA
jgi:hypothetical protein